MLKDMIVHKPVSYMLKDMIKGHIVHNKTHAFIKQNKKKDMHTSVHRN